MTFKSNVVARKRRWLVPASVHSRRALDCGFAAEDCFLSSPVSLEKAAPFPFLFSCRSVPNRTWLSCVDSEHDLAAMVHDFMENGSFESDFPESSDGESGLPSCSRLFETLQALKLNTTFVEKEILSILSVFLSSVKDVDLFCLTSGTECKGACIRRMLVKHLRVWGYDAAIRSSKWHNSGKVPGGEYEYIDVLVKGEKKPAERLIVDVDFQSQFEIARPTHSYAAALKSLPVVFIGSEEKLRQILKVMAEAAKMSLKQNSMPLPPWRTLDYMLAKWWSSADDTRSRYCRGQNSSVGRDMGIRQCVEQLKNLKLWVVVEVDKYHIQKPLNLERNRMIYFAARPLSSGFAVS
ncbi:hypothetical protein GOP47_0022480 [Adiantum capillus-veneris]|uniref:Uncharacterized protein n=1 Tax=Adiantum capillus-veneris TaxID=13818 RepID=A0A9D4U5G4_ADICA|nr:hypothetical protein GOP47_0022480 [Adiantum capillus-veneris]